MTDTIKELSTEQILEEISIGIQEGVQEIYKQIGPTVLDSPTHLHKSIEIYSNHSEGLINKDSKKYNPSQYNSFIDMEKIIVFKKSFDIDKEHYENRRCEFVIQN